MKQATVYIPDDLELALEEFRRSLDSAPDISSIAQAALYDYLARHGYATTRRALRIRPAQQGSGQSTISVEHDRFLTDP